MGEPLVQLTSVTKRFGSTTAVDDASLALTPGELHALIGENGAGKSTLLKIAAGALQASKGTVVIAGSPLEPATTAEAMRRGVGLVYQHFMLVGAFTALENLVLGAEPLLSFGRVDLQKAELRAKELAKTSGLDVPLNEVTDALTVGQRQRLEILRVLYRGAKVVLLDEPTAVLAPLEADELYGMLKKLAEGGTAIGVVTHRLEEVVRFADRVTVLRRGRVVLCRARSEGAFEEGELTRAIMGQAAVGRVEPPAKPPDDAPIALEIKGLSLRSPEGVLLVDGIDLQVRAGEVGGVAGIEGNGQHELVRAIAGLLPDAKGTILVGGQTISGATPRARRARLSVVHDDRHVDGLVLDATVGDNLVLGDLGDEHEAFDEAQTVKRRIDGFAINPADPARMAEALSGGNQQKIVVARALDRLRDVGDQGAIVVAQPTRGVDIGAAAVIQNALRSAAEKGSALIIVSADLHELRRLAHRIVVLFRGKIVAELTPDVSDEVLGRAMLGMEAA